jgi:hypothetical protein
MKNAAAAVAAAAASRPTKRHFAERCVGGGGRLLRPRSVRDTREAQLTDPEIITLCSQIVESQQREIDQMNAIIDRLASPDAGN